MTPKNIYDPDPGGVMTPENIFDPDPGGVMTPEIFFGPDPGGVSRGHDPGGVKPGLTPFDPDPGKTLIFWLTSATVRLTLFLLLGFCAVKGSTKIYESS